MLNIIWLQSAPTAIKNIGWKYYLCFITPSSFAAIVILKWFPDTRGLSLKECANIFGNDEELFSDEKRDVDGSTTLGSGGALMDERGSGEGSEPTKEEER